MIEHQYTESRGPGFDPHLRHCVVMEQDPLIPTNTLEAVALSQYDRKFLTGTLNLCVYSFCP